MEQVLLEIGHGQIITGIADVLSDFEFNGACDLGICDNRIVPEICR